MKYIISEAQYRFLTEQGSESRYGPEKFMSGNERFKSVHSPEAWAEVEKKQTEFLRGLNPHTINAIMGIASIFIPVVGPFIAAGIGLTDATAYVREGNKGAAALVTIFSLLPGAAAVVNKIPGIKNLGKQGMIALANKISKKAALTATELAVAEGVAANQALINTEMNNVAKYMAKQTLPRVADHGTKEALKKVAEHGVEHAAVHSVGNHS